MLSERTSSDLGEVPYSYPEAAARPASVELAAPQKALGIQQIPPAALLALGLPVLQQVLVPQLVRSRPWCQPVLVPQSVPGQRLLAQALLALALGPRQQASVRMRLGEHHLALERDQGSERPLPSVPVQLESPALELLEFPVQ